MVLPPLYVTGQSQVIDKRSIKSILFTPQDVASQCSFKVNNAIVLAVPADNNSTTGARQPVWVQTQIDLAPGDWLNVSNGAAVLFFG